MIEIKKARWKDLQCNLCSSTDDVYEIYFRSLNNNGNVIAMCKKCRSELRTRLKFKDEISEVVRCKDCKYYPNGDGSTKWLPCREIITPPSWFCADGEKK